jgi:hypothetical protein
MPATAPRRRSHYQQHIAERLALTGNIGIDPRHIEAFMRLEHPTLDGLSRGQFASEVDISAACVQQAGPAESEQLAESFGL